MKFLSHLINTWWHFMKIIINFLLPKEILNQPIFLNLKPNSILALVILMISTLSHLILSLINVLNWISL